MRDYKTVLDCSIKSYCYFVIIYPLKITFKYLMATYYLKGMHTYLNVIFIKTGIFELWYIIADRVVKILLQAFAVLCIMFPLPMIKHSLWEIVQTSFQ